MRRVWVFIISMLIIAWITVPITYTILSSFADLVDYYENVLPRRYTLRYYEEYLRLGVGEALVRSVLVGILTIILSMIIGLPAGYAIGRYVFRGRDSLKLAILFFKVIPIAIMAVPLAVLFIRVGLYDTLIGIALIHTAISLPFVVLTASSVFGSVPRDLEEAGYVFGMSGLQVMLRITLPLAAPGIAATALFAFLISWNEIVAAIILSSFNRTLPAAVMTPYVMGTGGELPDPYKFAATTIMVTPALIFMLYIRRYLIAMWGAAGVR
ncbi:carbohydrate ABC transporter permease [Desulfurococcaceae archaeon AG1]|jgi:multiple sugar transport system permease protein|nr:MAG: sugar ABC transporter permease [Desulfurococcaceae archaeon]GAY26194.1 carbohydrate ABC transporter permease [Desulfurococcaceae archaeon AG1]